MTVNLHITDDVIEEAFRAGQRKIIHDLSLQHGWSKDNYDYTIEGIERSIRNGSYITTPIAKAIMEAIPVIVKNVDNSEENEKLYRENRNLRNINEEMNNEYDKLKNKYDSLMVRYEYLLAAVNDEPDEPDEEVKVTRVSKDNPEPCILIEEVVRLSDDHQALLLDHQSLIDEVRFLKTQVRNIFDYVCPDRTTVGSPCFDCDLNRSTGSHKGGKRGGQ